MMHRGSSLRAPLGGLVSRVPQSAPLRDPFKGSFKRSFKGSIRGSLGY